jgi:apolipoprotein N-acyltransferase
LFSIGLILVAIPIIISLFIYKNHKNDSRSIEVAVIQPNIDPYNDKYGRTNLEILDEFKETTKELDFNNKLIVTPETYFSESPGYLLDNFFNTPFYKDLNSYLIKKNSQILSGIQFYKTYNSNETKTITSNYIRENLWVDIYNSSFINSEKKQVYHKSKLVVGVENLPYKSVLKPILGNILLDFGGTVMSRASQNERTVYETKNDFKVAPIICYESMYGEFINEYIRNGAEFLAIITNDGWWGDSQGHKQLLSLSRLRAIESRRSIVRSANTGISAIIDSRGNIIKSIPYNKKGVIFGEIKVSEKITFYNIYGDFIYRISLFLFLIVFLFYFAKKK